MTQEELIERLAEQEHAAWVRWVEYLFGQCETYMTNESLVIPGSFVKRWRKQLGMPYADLSEQEKQLDRDEVVHLLPLIEEYRKAGP